MVRAEARPGEDAERPHRKREREALVATERQGRSGLGLDAQRERREPGWAGVAAQLVGRPGNGGPACAAATAALGAAQALALLDGGDAPAALGAVLELDPVRGTLRRRPWAADPGCPCGARHS